MGLFWRREKGGGSEGLIGRGEPSLGGAHAPPKEGSGPPNFFQVFIKNNWLYKICIRKFMNENIILLNHEEK